MTRTKLTQCSPRRRGRVARRRDGRHVVGRIGRPARHHVPPPARPARPAPARSSRLAPHPGDSPDARVAEDSHKELTGKLNLNTATEDQLMLLPTVGPSKADRIVTWRKKNGAFQRTADLRRVKGFGYKTFKRLEPFLDIKGETTLAAK